MTLLIAGARRLEAGKTTFATGLVEFADGVGFKPRAGNDYWFHQDACRRAIDDGHVYGTDARRLSEAGPGQLDPLDVNPIHRLWQPAPGPGTGLLGQSDREFVLDRVGEAYLVNGTVGVPEYARDRLPLGDAVVVDSVDELNAAIRQHYLPALEALERTIDRTDRAVVESYADVARPTPSLEPSAVAVVEPTRARVYDGSRYVKSCSIASGGATPLEGQLEKRVPNVVELIDPVGTVELPPLTEGERTDPAAVANAYRAAYERLFEVAGWE